MKVIALIKKLQKLDPNAQIIMSSDEEGNTYSELDSVVDEKLYYAQPLEVYPEYTIEREIELGDWVDFKPEEEYTKPKKCIVLYPK